MAKETGVQIVGNAVASLREILGWTQEELGRRAGTSQGMVSAVEHAQLGDMTFSRAERLLAAMGARLVISVDAPFLGDRLRQRDPAHARCSTHVASRLRRAGWQVATEVEVGGDRSRGWIDVLAWHPETEFLLVIEIKTEIHDLGGIERALGWYEREAGLVAQRLRWRVRHSTGCLLLLATEANDLRVGANREPFSVGFPVRARDLSGLVAGLETAVTGRAVTMIDPLSKRATWLRPLRVDGRRSKAPYVDYADFMRAVEGRGRLRA
jgi:transcriptional regulator with XRE-family HTH domain